jgi:hypothetical protein
MGGSRPVRAGGHRAALRAPMLVVVSFAVAAPLSILFVAAGEARYPAFVLAVLGAAAFAVGWVADLAGSAVIGLVFWLFFDGFVVHRDGVLGWDGRTDGFRLAVLLTAAVLGSVLGILAPYLRRARTGLRTARRRFRRASLEPFTAELPSPRHPSFWN